jgi:hypothetical protein
MRRSVASTLAAASARQHQRRGHVQAHGGGDVRGVLAFDRTDRLNHACIVDQQHGLRAADETAQCIACDPLRDARGIGEFQLDFFEQCGETLFKRGVTRAGQTQYHYAARQQLFSKGSAEAAGVAGNDRADRRRGGHVVPCDRWLEEAVIFARYV